MLERLHADRWARYDGAPRRPIWSRIAATYLAVAADLQASLEHETGDAKKESTLKTVSLLTERAKKLRNVSRINNALTLAQELLGIKGNEWDSDPWLIGVENGVLDLRTGQLRDGQPNHYIRTVAPTSWRGLDAPAPRWERFISEIMSDEPDRVAFLQRLLGYGLNGSTKEVANGIETGAISAGALSAGPIANRQNTEAIPALPAHAIWHAHESDVPVTVTCKLGEHGGVMYLAIEGSQTGIPAHEVEFL